MLDFNCEISRIGTHCTQWDYIADRFGRSDVLPFSISDMDLACPSSLTEVLTQRLSHPVLGYSRWQHDAYLGAIQNWYCLRHDTSINSNWITYSPSVMYSIAKAIELLSRCGDNILIFTPVYNSFFDVVSNSNRNILVSDLICNESGYEIDWQTLPDKISKCSIVLFCSPHNPVGVCWDRKNISQLVSLCEHNNVWLLSDEIHSDFVFDTKFHSVLNYEYSKIVAFNSISKTFNVPALTGSYLISANEWFNKQFRNLIRYRDFVNSPAILNVIATIEAYTNCGGWLDELKIHIKKNILIAKKYILEHIPSLRIIDSNSTYLIWIDCAKLYCTDKELQWSLINIGKVGIMSGSTYGASGCNYLRLNVGCSQKKLIVGLQRLELTVNTILGKNNGY